MYRTNMLHRMLRLESSELTGKDLTAKILIFLRERTDMNLSFKKDDNKLQIYRVDDLDSPKADLVETKLVIGGFYLDDKKLYHICQIGTNSAKEKNQVLITAQTDESKKDLEEFVKQYKK